MHQHVIKSNRKAGESQPVITVKTSKSNIYGFEVKVKGNAGILYRPHKPLSCGANVWIETSLKWSSTRKRHFHKKVKRRSGYTFPRDMGTFLRGIGSWGEAGA